MAVQHGIWRIGAKPEALKPVRMETELLLEQQIVQDISILSEDWLLIGRQVKTAFNKLIDLLAIDVSGAIIIIELKKHRTPRDVVAQAIDYASWVETLPSDRLMEIYNDFAIRHQLPITNLDEAFRQKFGLKLLEEQVNSSHQMVIVAAELDDSTERIINYLNEKAGIAINAVFFNVFQDAGNQYLSRAWMIDPKEAQDHVDETKQKSDWNGEYYASFGAYDNGRNWEDAVNYGFLSAGNGRWYSKTLYMLQPGDRVWVNIPRTGYVGVAEVTEQVTIADDFLTENMTLKGTYSLAKDVGEENAEYFVPVRWIKSVSENEAINEVGLFGNQNSVARPRASKWDYTVKRLKEVWKL